MVECFRKSLFSRVVNAALLMTARVALVDQDQVPQGG